MDSRIKIVSAEEAASRIRASGKPARVVTGYFDPLLAAHALRLRELAADGRMLVALIRTPAGALLPARARAELVAGLEMVDLVVEDGPDAFERLDAGDVVREEEADEARSREFARHVRERY